MRNVSFFFCVWIYILGCPCMHWDSFLKIFWESNKAKVMRELSTHSRLAVS